MKRKQKTIWIGLFVVLVGISLGGYKYYNYMSGKYYRKAKAFERLAEYESAINNFRRHLLRHPDDIEAKIELTGVYLRIGKNEECLGLSAILLEDISGLSDKLRHNIADSLFVEFVTALPLKKYSNEYKRIHKNMISAYTKLLTVSKVEADSLVSVREYGTAREKYVQTLEYRKKEYKIKMNLLSLERESEKWDDETINRLIAFVEDVAKIAFCDWMIGQAPEAIMGTLQRNIADLYFKQGQLASGKQGWKEWYLMGIFPRACCFGVASRIEEVATLHFENKEWGEARKHYNKVLELYKSAEDSSNVVRTKYNIAMTFWGQKHFIKARGVLKEIGKEFPDYEKSKIRKFKGEATQWHFRNLASSCFDKAAKNSEDKDYYGARENYKRALMYSKKAGIPNGSEIHAPIRFNIMLTYIGQEKYSKAREELNKIKALHPTYCVERIKDIEEALMHIESPKEIDR